MNFIEGISKGEDKCNNCQITIEADDLSFRSQEDVCLCFKCYKQYRTKVESLNRMDRKHRERIGDLERLSIESTYEVREDINDRLRLAIISNGKSTHVDLELFMDFLVEHELMLQIVKEYLEADRDWWGNCAKALKEGLVAEENELMGVKE